MAEYWEFMPNSGNAFFISYNSPDWQRVAPIAKTLNDMGYPVWYDYGLEAGTARWKAQISASIDRCYAVIVFVTKGIFTRERCYVLNEHDEATGIKKTVIPVFLDSIDLSFVPPDYRSYVTEWNSLQGVPYKYETSAQTARRIAGIIEHSRNVGYKLSGTAGQAAQPAPRPVSTSVPAAAWPAPVKKSKNRSTTIITAAALIAAVLFGVVWLPGLMDRNGDNTPAVTEPETAVVTEDETPSPAETEAPAEDSDKRADKTIPYLSDATDVSVGSRVYFGSYLHAADGDVQPVEWRVLDIKGGNALLISEYLIDCKEYHREVDSVTWETCTLRSWLNKDFYYAAFSDDEQKKIVLAHNTNPDNPNYGSDGGSDTDDHVFLLSLGEAEKYFSSDSDRRAEPSSYSKSKGANVKYGYGWWWLRSSGGLNSDAVSIADDGTIHDYGDIVESYEICVRPAVLVSLSD